jgi:hypothetical protein
MMTVIATLKQQYRHVFDYLTAVCAATLHANYASSSLPTANDIKRPLCPAA